MPQAHNQAFLSENQWRTLLECIDGDWCTPILGPEVNSGALSRRERIARQLCRAEPEYPHAFERDLVQVCQFLSVMKGPPQVWRNLVVQAIRRQIGSANGTGADEVYRILASLKLSLYVTTNFDRHMARALEDRPALVREEICPWNLLSNEMIQEEYPLRRADFQLTPAQPVVYYLFGNLDKPMSMVLSHDDNLDFLAHVANTPAIPVSAASGDQSVLPNKLRANLQANYLLFLGYRINDYEFHILMRSLRTVLRAKQVRRNPLIAVQLEDPGSGHDTPPGLPMEWLREYTRLLEAQAESPDRKQRVTEVQRYLKNLETVAERRAKRVERLRAYLRTLCEDHNLEVIFGSCSEFLRELGRRYQEDQQRRQNRVPVEPDTIEPGAGGAP